MPKHDIVVVGGSAGAIDALQVLVAGLPEPLSASIFIVVHLRAAYASALARVLGRKTHLPVHEAENNRSFERGHIYVAVPDHHLLLENDRMIVVRGPKENRNRPALDPLFRAAALNYRSRVIGVVLSGVL